MKLRLSKINILIFAIVSIISFRSFAQPDPSIAKTRKVHLSNEDSAITTEALIRPKDICLKPDRDYFWTYSGKILTTQGNYSGDLLHGMYQVFYPNKNLRLCGHFRYGLKEGLWQTWYDNGKLEQTEHYCQGLINGKQELFDHNGKVIKIVRYHKGRIISTTNVGSTNKKGLKLYQWHLFKSNTKPVAALYF